MPTPLRQAIQLAEGQKLWKVKHLMRRAPPPPANTVGGEGLISRGKVRIPSFRVANWRKGFAAKPRRGDGDSTPLHGGFYLSLLPGLLTTGSSCTSKSKGYS